MRRIRNPFRGLEGYNCFGCSPDNQSGLQLSFVEEGDELVSAWKPKSFLQGYHNVLHGGIQATMMDEIASWVVYVKLQTSGVTSGMTVRFLKPVYITDDQLTLRAKVKEMRRNLADIEVKLFDGKGVLCAQSLVTYFTFSKEQSRKNLFYPEHKDFFEEDRHY
jgi:uncharacterized protein (TIGR00369 family)